ncbi:MAG: amidase [Rhodospirillaceae bacterium]|nr:amidase [Rhodospirillaceae bacterium]
MSLIELTATQAAQKIRDGEITSEKLVQACLDRIEQIDGEIQAWAHLKPEYALEQARTLDARRQAGGPIGPLHGVPVGIKDIINTRSLPTENGTVLDQGRQPREDSRVVTLLKEAGAVIMGKTVTTELAVFAPGKTRNPHNPAHTPGGSSSGSCAAVAAYMVPLAIGTQTTGSILRPASYCGIYGFKPTHGLIPRTGVLSASSPLDTIGTFARCLEDIALLSEALIASDPGDRYTRARARPALCDVLATEPPMPPVIAFARTAVWDQADETTQEAFEELVEALGDDCNDLPLSEPFDHLIDMHRNIMYADLAKNYASYYENGKDQLSDTLCGMIEFGQKVSAVDYNTAIDGQDLLNSGLDMVFDHFDIIITPATTGEAPEGLESTGSPVFNSLATYCGTPAITLPMMEGPNGLPLGVQVIGPRNDDARLLRNANWLMKRVLG